VEEASEAAVVAVGSEEEVRAVTGKGVIVSRKGRKLIDEAVRDAEAVTGLQFCVYLGPVTEDSREQAESMFVQAGLVERPAVLLLVAPDQHKVEIVTAPDARERLTDEECAQALQEMTPYFARNAFIDGLVVGLRELAERTGPGKTDPSGTDLPNVLG
jgi:uncharacterized membrane protein YgcG